jgi:hypothetical protein
MFYRITTTSWLAAFFGILAVFGQALAKGETNESSNATLPTRFVWLAEKSTYQGKADTNGMTLSFSMNNSNINSCGISLSNQSKSKFYCWCYPNHYPSTWLKVELVDSTGQPVEKTKIGKQYGQPFDMVQLHEMVKERYRQWTLGRFRGTGFEPIVASEGWLPLTDFNLPDLFELKQAGEYTLHVQLPLLQKIGADAANPELKIVWLPEVIAKIQIRTADKKK